MSSLKTLENNNIVSTMNMIAVYTKISNGTFFQKVSEIATISFN